MLWQNIAWRALHNGWVEPNRQHDVFEYLGFLRPKLGAGVTLQCRQMHDARTDLLDVAFCSCRRRFQCWTLGRMKPCPCSILSTSGCILRPVFTV